MPTCPRALRRAQRPPLRLAAALAAALVVLPLPVAVPAARATVLAPFVESDAMTLAPGATHAWGSVTTEYGSQRVNVVTADPGVGTLAVEAVLSNNRASGLERTSEMARRRSREGHRVVAAVNADVWSGTGTLLGQAPNGIHIQGGELMVADGLTRATFGIGPDRVPLLGQIRETITVTAEDGTSATIAHLNQGPAGTIALFSPRFGTYLSTALTGVEVEIRGVALPLRPVGSWTGTVTAIRPAGSGAAIPSDGLVLVLPARTPLLASLALTAPVAIGATITPGWEGVTEAVSGRGILVRGGTPYVMPRPADAPWTHPRSALGIDRRGKLIVVTVDGRDTTSRGISLDDLAALMLDAGAVEAMNFDGGSSTTLAVRRNGDILPTVANVPSAGYEIRVTSSLQLVSTIPTGPLASLVVRPAAQTLYETRSRTFTAGGMDASYNGIALTSGDRDWTTDAGIGRIDRTTGLFAATTPGTGSVRIRARGVTGIAPVEVLDDTTAPAVGAPRAIPVAQRAIRTAIPVLLRWGAAADAESGLARYELERSVDGGAWAAVALPSPTATSLERTLARGRDWAFRLRAVDRAGNAGEWRETRFRLAVVQERGTGSVLAGTWRRRSGTAYDGGATVGSTARGANVTFSFTGSAVAWVGARGPRYGKATISVDGGPAATIDLRMSQSRTRRILWARSWASGGPHVVRIRVVGTGSYRLVDIDAFVVLRTD